jgi:endonuclease/exonuclease/phosphatase family metal-dependent hydrolase
MKILTFNIRYPEPADGDNIWENRRDAVVKTIRQSGAAVVGLQEPVIEQLRYFDTTLPAYRRFGVSRYGNDDEKFTAILYRPDTLDLLDHGAFWFSQTPDVPASSSWLIHKPYAVNWGQFAHLATGRKFHVYNTHFPYKPEQAEARLQAARLIHERAAGERVFVTGDFNNPAPGPVYDYLTQHFKDSWKGDSPGTFHGFTGVPTGRRIDWILYRGQVAVESCQAITEPINGRYPSDHFPVLGSFRFA